MQVMVTSGSRLLPRYQIFFTLFLFIDDLRKPYRLFAPCQSSQRLNDYKCHCDFDIRKTSDGAINAYLQVLSLSSCWRSLQYSSVCLQEHRQVTGSCTNKRFLLSEQ